jgi:hypothetical protein
MGAKRDGTDGDDAGGVGTGDDDAGGHGTGKGRKATTQVGTEQERGGRRGAAPSTTTRTCTAVRWALYIGFSTARATGTMTFLPQSRVTARISCGNRVGSARNVGGGAGQRARHCSGGTWHAWVRLAHGRGTGLSARWAAPAGASRNTATDRARLALGVEPDTAAGPLGRDTGRSARHAGCWGLAVEPVIPSPRTLAGRPGGLPARAESPPATPARTAHTEARRSTVTSRRSSDTSRRSSDTSRRSSDTSRRSTDTSRFSASPSHSRPNA